MENRAEILCDNCQSEIKLLNADYKDLLEAFSYMASFFWGELGWCHFRAEFLANGDNHYETAQRQNAQAIAKMLASCEEKWPSLKNAIKERIVPIKIQGQP